MNTGRTHFKKGHISWNTGKGKHNPICPDCHGKKSYMAKHCRSCSLNYYSVWNKGLKGFMAGDKHWKWQKENPSYRAVHAWMSKTLGKAKVCSFDSDHKSKRFEWANISGSYLRDTDDFASLCKKCHNDYDRIRRGGSRFVSRQAYL